jgi:hypothetical protein
MILQTPVATHTHQFTSHIPVSAGTLQPEIKLPSTAQIKIEWSYTSAPRIHLHDIHSDKFAFTFYPKYT